MLDINERLHNNACEEIAVRLRKKGHLEIYVNKEYEHNYLHGEVDICTFKNGYVHFYEYKLRHCAKRYATAKEQYTRFCKAYPDWKVKGIYIAGGCRGPIVIRRIYL